MSIDLGIIVTACLAGFAGYALGRIVEIKDEIRYHRDSIASFSAEDWDAQPTRKP